VNDREHRPDPETLLDRTVAEGQRWSTLELVSTSFIARFTVFFGIIALSRVVEAYSLRGTGNSPSSAPH